MTKVLFREATEKEAITECGGHDDIPSPPLIGRGGELSPCHECKTKPFCGNTLITFIKYPLSRE